MTSVWGGPEQEPAGVCVGWPRAGAGGSLGAGRHQMWALTLSQGLSCR